MNSGLILTALDRNHEVDPYLYPHPLQTEINSNLDEDLKDSEWTSQNLSQGI